MFQITIYTDNLNEIETLKSEFQIQNIVKYQWIY